MKRFLITAGPTREPIDAVRYISNRSSGTMGIAIAHAAVAAGHEVTLLLGPVCQPQLSACRIHRFESSTELKQLLEAHFADHDVLIMAAAVADYRAMAVSHGKLPRQSDEALTLKLHATPDLVALMAQRKRAHQRIVAFALEEPQYLEARAADKLKRKKVDAIVANPLATMDGVTVTALWLTADPPRREMLDNMDKRRFADWLIDKIAATFF